MEFHQQAAAAAEPSTSHAKVMLQNGFNLYPFSPVASGTIHFQSIILSAILKIIPCKILFE